MSRDGVGRGRRHGHGRARPRVGAYYECRATRPGVVPGVHQGVESNRAASSRDSCWACTRRRARLSATCRPYAVKTISRGETRTRHPVGAQALRHPVATEAEDVQRVLAGALAGQHLQQEASFGRGQGVDLDPRGGSRGAGHRLAGLDSAPARVSRSRSRIGVDPGLPIGTLARGRAESRVQASRAACRRWCSAAARSRTRSAWSTSQVHRPVARPCSRRLFHSQAAVAPSSTSTAA